MSSRDIGCNCYWQKRKQMRVKAHENRNLTTESICSNKVSIFEWTTTY